MGCGVLKDISMGHGSVFTEGPTPSTHRIPTTSYQWILVRRFDLSVIVMPTDSMSKTISCIDRNIDCL